MRPSDDRDLAAIEYEGWRLIELGRLNPDRTVPQYPTWTMRDLVFHVAGVHGRTAMICETLPAGRIPGPELPLDLLNGRAPRLYPRGVYCGTCTRLRGECSVCGT